MKKIDKVIAFLSVALLPSGTAFAQGQTLGTLIDKVLSMLNGIIPVIIALALIYFMWGVAQYIKGAGDAKQEGRQIMIWGVIALFVMTSVYGLVNVVARTLDLENTQPNVPQLRFAGSSSGSFSATQPSSRGSQTSPIRSSQQLFGEALRGLFGF